MPEFRRTDIQEIWCADKSVLCGYYNVRTRLEHAIARYMKENNLTKDNVKAVSGIGCSGRFTVYQDFCTFHTTHGNAGSFSEGLSLALRMGNKKDLVYMVSGDGDSLAIGLANYINLCHENPDISLFILNNQIFAMTSGQTSPTTDENIVTITSPHGVIEKPRDPIALALAEGATYIARCSAFPKDSERLEKIAYNAFNHKGISIVVVDSPCPTQNPSDKGKKTSELCLEYFKNSFDINKIYTKKNLKKINLTDDNGIVLPMKIFKIVESVGKNKYFILKDYLDSKGYNDIKITGEIFEIEKKTLDELILEKNFKACLRDVVEEDLLKNKIK